MKNRMYPSLAVAVLGAVRYGIFSEGDIASMEARLTNVEVPACVFPTKNGIDQPNDSHPEV